MFSDCVQERNEKKDPNRRCSFSFATLLDLRKNRCSKKGIKRGKKINIIRFGHKLHLESTMDQGTTSNCDNYFIKWTKNHGLCFHNFHRITSSGFLQWIDSLTFFPFAYISYLNERAFSIISSFWPNWVRMRITKTVQIKTKTHFFPLSLSQPVKFALNTIINLHHRPAPM